MRCQNILWRDRGRFIAWTASGKTRSLPPYPPPPGRENVAPPPCALSTRRFARRLSPNGASRSRPSILATSPRQPAPERPAGRSAPPGNQDSYIAFTGLVASLPAARVRMSRRHEPRLAHPSDAPERSPPTTDGSALLEVLRRNDRLSTRDAAASGTEAAQPDNAVKSLLSHLVIPTSGRAVPGAEPRLQTPRRQPRTQEITALGANQRRLAERMFGELVPECALCRLPHLAANPRRGRHVREPQAGPGCDVQPPRTRGQNYLFALRQSLEGRTATAGLRTTAGKAELATDPAAELGSRGSADPRIRCSASSALRRCLTRFCASIANTRITCPRPAHHL